MSAKKQTIKRACIDCHFLVEKQDDTEEAGLEPHEMDPRITYHYVEANRREPIKSNDYSWIKFPLVCYRGCWTEVYDKEKQHEEVVEKDRRGCPLAYPYTEGMSFDAAKEMQGSVRLLRAGQIRAQSDQTKPLPVQQSSGNGFVKKTDYWLISYEGETIQLTVSGNLGLEYIAHLLGNRGREYESHKLRNIVENKTPIDSRDTVKYGKKDEWYKDNKETADERPKKGFKATMDGVDVVLDGEAFQDYKDALKEYNEDLDEAKKNNDLGQIDKIEADIDFIKSQMVANAGLKYHPRKFKSVNETARKAIGNNVNRVYKKLEKEHQPLWNHLKKNITISHNCSYSPEKDIDWNIKL